MADTYTLQYPGERVDQDLERAERATVDLPLAATLGAEAQGFPLVVTTAVSEVNEMYKLYAANRSRYRWMLVVTQASGGAFVEVAEVEPVTQSGGIDLVFDSKYNGRRYAVTLKLAGGRLRPSARTSLRTSRIRSCRANRQAGATLRSVKSRTGRARHSTRSRRPRA